MARTSTVDYSKIEKINKIKWYYNPYFIGVFFYVLGLMSDNYFDIIEKINLFIENF